MPYCITYLCHKYNSKKNVSKLHNKNSSIKIPELSNGVKNESNFVQGSIERKILRKVIRTRANTLLKST